MGSEEREALVKRLCKELSERSGQIFIPEKIRREDSPPFWVCSNVCRDRSYYREHREEMEGSFFDYLKKWPDGRVLGTMYLTADFRKVYFDSRRKIKWPDDWIDPYPASIDSVKVTDEYVTIWKGYDTDLNFICLAYYAVKFDVNMYIISLEIPPGVPNDILTRVLSKREERIRVSRFVPAVVKDLNIFFKMLNEVLAKHGLDISEAYPRVNRFDCRLVFKISDMSDESIIDGVLKRVDALTELRRRFREWLPSDERRAYYESTMLFPEDPFRWRFYIPEGGFPVPEWWKSSLPFRRRYEGPRILCKWPPNVDPDLDKRYEGELKEKLWSSESFRYYDFDGNRLRLARKTKSGLKFLGKVVNKRKGWVRIDKNRVREEDLDREDIVIAVDERLEKLPKFPLEKIEFLKEDFPEMFK